MVINQMMKPHRTLNFFYKVQQLKTRKKMILGVFLKGQNKGKWKN
jgi:hypothetical protein